MPFRVPTHLTIEPGCLARLSEALAAFPDGPVLLVTDRGLAATDWPAKVRQLVEGAGRTVEGYDGVEANPRAETAESQGARLRDGGFAVVIGLGGGSALDAAKAAAMSATNPGPMIDYEGKERFSSRPLPYIAIPTTCGTGSEVTWVSVLSVPPDEEGETGRKISVKGEGMFPDVALVDPDLLTTLPAPLVAATALDALTHALEAYTGLAANPASDTLAVGAIARLLRFTERAWRDVAGDEEARVGVATGSTIAGLSFGNADVAAVHCLSESLGGLYDVPHGLTNGLLLVPVLRSHGPAASGRLGRLAAELPRDVSAASGAALLERIERLVEAVELPPFSSLGVPREEYPTVARLAVANGSNPSNPRPMGEADYLAILESL